MMTFGQAVEFEIDYPHMRDEMEALQDMMVNFVSKYRIVLEDKSVGNWFMDQRDFMQVIVDNSKALCIADRVPEYWEEEEYA